MRVIGQDGQQLGVITPNEGRRIAKERGLDLVEVSPDSNPPVCKLLDYGKWRYENDKKKKAKKSGPELREVKMRPKIDEHDYQVKSRTVRRLLKGGDKVKVTMRFRGREVTHDDLARDILVRIQEDSGPLAKVEAKPSRQGRTMSMVLVPTAAEG